MTRKLAIILLVAALAAGACSGDSASETTEPPTTVPPTTPVTAPQTTLAIDRGDVPLLFDVAGVALAGERWTVAVAASPQQRARGLMEVTDLGDLDGMLFVFDRDSTGGFWMKDTLLPLEIAFFAADGGLVDVLSMTPCEADPCPLYQPAGPYRYAVEALPGRLAGLGPDALLVVDG